jgi:hypothetical protein
LIRLRTARLAATDDVARSLLRTMLEREPLDRVERVPLDRVLLLLGRAI